MELNTVYIYLGIIVCTVLIAAIRYFAKKLQLETEAQPVENVVEDIQDKLESQLEKKEPDKKE